MTSHAQTVQINTRAVAAQKIKAQPGQALQLVIDGVAYVGQPQIKGKAVQLVRKGRQLEVQLQDQTVAVVEDFYASEGAATGAAPGQALALSAQDTLALLQEGSAVQVAAAPAGEAAVALPQWGTLVAQANTSTTGGAAAATASAAPAATGVGMGTVLLGALGLAALASGGGGSKDSTAPTATVADNTTGTATGAVTYTIAFNEAVKGFDASKITASAGTLSDFVASADGKTFTIVLTPPANATGSAQLSISTSGVTDAAGNTAVAPTVAAQAYDTVPPDTTAPTASVTASTAGTASGPLVYTIAFTEAVKGFDASKVSTNAGTLGGFAANPDGKTFVVIFTPPANATGSAQLSISTSGVTDAAGNTAVAPTVAAQAYDTVPPDTTAPTASVTASTAGTASGPLVYTIAFTEAVKGFDASKITASAGTLSDFVASADGKTFTIVLTPPANATGSAQLSISTSGVTDAAGNTAVAPTVAAQAYDTVPPDTTAPTASVTASTAGTASGPLVYTIAFTEAVKGFDASKVSTNAGTLGGFAANPDGKTFVVIFTPPANATGSAQLSISTSGVTDAAGNTAVAPTVAAQAYDTVPPDTTAPTVTVTDNVTGTATGPVTYTVKFSEAVTGFDASKLSLSGGSLGALTKVSDSEYTVVATPAATASGTLKLSVSTTGVTDAAGNVAVAPTVADQAYAQNVLTGSIVAGPVVTENSLSVKVFNAAGVVIGTSSIGPNGSYTVAVGNYTGPVAVLVVDTDDTKPDYVDEVTKKPVDLSGNLLAAGNVVAGATTQTLNVNPITTVAALKAGFSASTDGTSVLPNTSATTEAALATKIDSANTAVAKALGLGSTAADLLTVTIVPTVNVDGTANTSANTYGKLLAVVAGMDAANAGDASKTLNTLVAGITDSGTLNTTAQTALTQGATQADVPTNQLPSGVVSGGSNDTPPPPPVPAFTSGGSAAFAENAPGVVYTAAATPVVSGKTITYSLSGTDADLFDIDPESGEISFVDVPNHESPADVGADNVYQVTVTASEDGNSNVATQNVAITVTDVADVAPVFTSANAVSVAENTTTVVYTPAATPDVSGATVGYTLSGADVGLFDFVDGKVTFKDSPNYEIPTDVGSNNEYNITVTATTGSLSSTQDVVISVTNVNDVAPTLSGVPSAATTAVVGQALALADFTVADVDSTNVTVTLTANNGTIGGVTDADATVDGIQVTGTVSAVNTALAAATFTATAAGAASVGITVSDGSLSATGTYSLTGAVAPSLSTTLGGVSNFDARSNIVLTASDNVTAVQGKKIFITNTGGTGFHGENTVNTFEIDAADTSKVTINNGKITINPQFDLDLANNYTLSVQEGAFLGASTNQPSVALAPVSFSTVAPMSAAGGTAGTQSQTMAADGTLLAGAYWLDLEDRSNILATAVEINAAGKDMVFVAGDYMRSALAGSTGIGVDDFHVRLYNFGVGDMLYIDNRGDNADVSATLINQTTFNTPATDTLSGDGTKSIRVVFAGINVPGETTGSAYGGRIVLSLAPSDDVPSDHTVAAKYTTLSSLLDDTPIGNIFAVL